MVVERVLGSQRGSSLVIVLLVLSVLAAVVGALVVTTSGEALVAGRFGERAGGRYAAHAASELAVAALRSLDNWSTVVDGTAVSPYVSGPIQVVLADGTVLDLAALDAEHQSLSDAVAPWGANNPAWTRFVWGPMSVLSEVTLGPPSPYYLVAWVADDGEDGDGNPWVDSNGVVQIHAAAYGARGARLAVTTRVARVGAGPSGVRRVSWRDDG